MIIKSKYRKFFPVFIFLLITLFTIKSRAQTSTEVYNAIQQANEKLGAVVEALELASLNNVEVKDLTIETDLARELIAEAWQSYLESEYSEAQEKSNQASYILEEIEEEINLRNNNKKRNSKIIYSLVGIFSAFLTLYIFYLFFTKIQPWYKAKMLEEYSKLEIIYPEEKEVKK